MVFVDELAYYLFLVAFPALLLGYFLIKVYLSYRKNKMDIRSELEGLWLPLLFAGLFILVSGIASQLTWPISATGAQQYNILYFDPMAAFGLILTVFSLCLRYKTKTQYTGFISLLAGLMTIWYGWSAYGLSLSTYPLELLLLFVFFGGAAMLTYPATVILDNWPKSKSSVPKSWIALLALLCIFLVAAGVTAFYIGSVAIPAHLMSPP